MITKELKIKVLRDTFLLGKFLKSGEVITVEESKAVKLLFKNGVAEITTSEDDDTLVKKGKK